MSEDQYRTTIRKFSELLNKEYYFEGFKTITAEFNEFAISASELRFEREKQIEDLKKELSVRSEIIWADFDLKLATLCEKAESYIKMCNGGKDV